MISAIVPSGTQRPLGTVARLLSRLGLLSLFLFIADRWTLKKGEQDRPAFPFVTRKGEVEYQILIYHRVNDDRDPFFPAVPIRAFKAQMEVLAQHFNVLPLEELVERSHRHDVPPHAIAVTLDDGYRDNYAHAFPICQQIGLPATVFLTTGGLNNGAPLWHDRVFHAFRYPRAKSIVMAGTEYGLASVAERRVALNRAALDLKAFHPRKRDDMIQQLILKLDVQEDYPEALRKLDWQQVREMSRHKITFGAHTVTHPILTRMPLAEAVDEVMLSKRAIEQQLGMPVKLFAYPNGGRDDFNESLKAAVKELGFVCAVTTLWGTNGPRRDPFELRRVGIWDPDPWVSALRLGWYRLSSERSEMRSTSCV